MASLPSQVAHPSRATIRTVVAAVVGFAAIFPTIVNLLGLPEWSGVTIAIAAAGAVTRVFANPVVEEYIKKYLPWLAAEPPA